MQAAGELPAPLDLSAITAEPPRDPTHGDIATNAAMVLAKRRAQEAARHRRAAAGAAHGQSRRRRRRRRRAGLHQPQARAIGSGASGCATACAPGPAYGDSQMGGGRTVNVEYVSANPTGPLHVAHARGAVVGDALANLLPEGGLRRHQGILHQRRRRAGRHARPLDLPALPRGAGRGDRRHPRGPLSRRVPQGGRRGDRPARRRALARQAARPTGCRRCATSPSPP